MPRASSTSRTPTPRPPWPAAGLLAAALVLTAAAPPAPHDYTTPLTLAQMRNKQAVVQTTDGTFVIDLLPDLAPNHVGYFIKLAEDGIYAGTIFHRVVRDGIIEGGDPLTKNPANRARYGTGGLNVLKAELSDAKQLRGTVSAITIPGRPDSGGSQFFICVTDQPGLTERYSVFGRVVDGLDVVRKISEAPTDAHGRPLTRIVITGITIRDKPPPAPDPFRTMTPSEMAKYRAVLETPLGPITLGFLPEKAPETVRNFLRLASHGVYNGMTFHRVVKGFVIQTGALSSRTAPLSVEQQALIHALPPEFNDTPQVPGTVSMAHGNDPASATTSFFICTGNDSALDGKYTAFARVLDGMTVVRAIEAAPTHGETPVTPIALTAVRLERVPQ